MLSIIQIVYHNEIKLLSTSLTKLLDWLAGARCVGCRRRGEYLCSSCIDRAPLADAVPAPEFLALFSYDYLPIKRAVWLLKYRGVRRVAEPFGQAMAERLIEYLAEATALYPGETAPWLVVPIPLSRERQRERGFNQAEVIAQHLAARQPGVLKLAPDLLAKVIHTASQVSIKNREQRLQNLRGAFVVTNQASVANRNLILVDDVITTGATMLEAKKVLRAAGAKRVIGLAIAHG